MVTGLALMIEAGRLPRVCPMALGYGLPPCDDNLLLEVRALQLEPKILSTFHLGGFKKRKRVVLLQVWGVG